MNYVLHITVLVAIYAILAVSLNLTAGCTGLLSLAHAAFFGIGAYAVGITTTMFHWSFWEGALLGLGLAFLCSFGVALPALRVGGDYLVIATLAFQVFIHSVFQNWVDVTRGPMGLPGIPRPKVFGWSIESREGFLVFALGCAGFCFWLCRRATSAPFGRVLRAIREDEVLVASLGKNISRFKVAAFAMSAVLAAGAGALYAGYITFVDPTSFTTQESILILSMVIVGGSGNGTGSLVGATLLVTLPELLRFVGLPAAAAGNLRQIIYGLFLIVVVVFRPQGFIGEYGFQTER